MGHDELREGADDNRVTQLATYPRGLLKNFRQSICDTKRRELRLQIGYHSTRHLMLVVESVVFNDATDWLALASGDVAQALGNLFNRPKIDGNIETIASYVLDKPFGGRMGCAVGQHGCRRMDHIHAEFDGAARCVRREPCEAMRVQMQG